MTRRCPICGLDTFNKKVIQTGYLNISAIKECSNCTWKQVIRLSGPGGPAIGKIVAEQREALRQVLQRTGSIQATAAELKGRQVERRRSFSAAEQAATRLTSDTSRPRSPRLPKPKPPRPSRSRLLLERARSTAPAVTPQSGCGLCGNTIPAIKPALTGARLWPTGEKLMRVSGSNDQSNKVSTSSSPSPGHNNTNTTRSPASTPAPKPEGQSFSHQLEPIPPPH